MILISLLVFSCERKFPTKIPTVSNSEAPATLGVSGPASYIPVSSNQFGPDSSRIWPRVLDTAVDTSGNIYLTTERSKLYKVSSSYTLINEWTAVVTGSLPGIYSALSFDSNGTLFASLSYLTGPVGDYIYKINPTTGEIIDSFATEGSGNGELLNVKDILHDSEDNLYVLDSNANITKFDSQGNFVLRWSLGIESGAQMYPNGIAIDAADDVYISEGNYNNSVNRVRKYSPLGVLINSFGSAGTGDGEFSKIGKLGIDGTGNIYVADKRGARIQKFNSSYTFQTSWNVTNVDLNAEENYYIRSSVTYTSEGNLLIIRNDFPYDGYTVASKYDTNGVFIENVGQSFTDEGLFAYAFDAATDGQYMYIIDYDLNRVQKFTMQGLYVSEFGSFGTADGEFDFTSGIAIDSEGYIYIVDRYRVQKFNSSGMFVLSWGGQGSGNGEFNGMYGGVAIDADDYIYVVDTNNNRIQKFDSDGNHILSWGVSGSGEGEFQYPEGIAIDELNNVYVVDAGNYRIQKFTSEGDFLLEWGEEGPGDAQFQYPTGVEVDQLGNVYVSDSYGDGVIPLSIKIFDSSGNLLSVSSGEDINTQTESSYIEDLFSDEEGNLYIMDASNYKVVRLVFDRLPADVDITPFSGNQTYDTTPTIGGTVTDNLTNISSIQASLDGGNYANCSATDGTLNELSESFSCAYASSIGVGSHTITIRSTDSRANTNSGADLGTYTFTVLASATPTPTPTATSTTTPTATAIPTATATPTDSFLPSVTTTPTFGIIDTPLATLSPTPSTTQGSNIPESCLDFADLTVSDTIIKRGSEVLITWEALCTEQIVVQPSGDVLAAKGSKRFSPTETTVYEFTATNKGTSVTKKVTVQVVDTLPWTGTIAAGSGLLLLEAVVALQQPVIFGNIWLSLAGLVRKKKRNAWGVVYDSISKRPLGRVVIRLMNAENKVTDTAVSDANGTFVLAAKQGSYTISAKLGGYSFPSKIVSGTVDGAFGNVYVGSVVNVTGDTSGLLVSIPLDPESLSDADRVRANAKQQFPKIIEGLSTLLVVCGALYSLIVLWQFPHNLNLLISSVYFFALFPKILRRFGTETQGSVLYEDGTPAANIEIGLFDSEFKTLLYRTFTNKDGKYTLAVPNVNYDLKLLDQKYKLVYGGKQQLSVSINKKGNAGVRIIALDLIVKS